MKNEGFFLERKSLRKLCNEEEKTFDIFCHRLQAVSVQWNNGEKEKRRRIKKRRKD